MKNKSKLKKIKQMNAEKKAGMSQNKVPSQWLYMNATEVSFEQIKEMFAGSDKYSVQIWDEMGFLEIEIAEAKSIDIERTSPDLGDEYSNTFLQKNNVKTLWFVTISPEQYQLVKAVFSLIIENCGGFFCGDSEDFKPIVGNAVEV